MINTVKVVPDSLDIREIDVNLIATGAGFTAGDVVQIPVDSDGGYTTCITPTAAGIGTVASAICSDALFGVVLVTVAQNAVAKVRLQGKVSATCLSTADANLVFTGSSGSGQFFADTSKRLQYDEAGSDANKKIIALVTTAVTGGGGVTSTPTLRTVFFNGITGFCRNGGSAS